MDLELSLRIRIRPGEKVSDITVIEVIVLSAEFIQFIMFVGSLKKITTQNFKNKGSFNW